MSVGDIVDSVADIGGDLIDSAVDVGSSLSDLGTEFLDAAGDWGGDFLDTASTFGGDIYENVTSFAGNADFFNTNFIGDIVGSGITTVTEFGSNLFSGFSLPSISVPGLVNAGIAAIAGPSLGSFGLPGLSIPGLVNSTVASLAGPSTGGFGIPGLSTPGFGSSTGYGVATPGFGGGGFSVAGLVNSSVAGLTNAAVGGITGQPVRTAGIGYNTGYGVGTPGFAGSTYTGGLLDSALTFVTGSSTAQAQVNNRAPAAVSTAVDPWANVPVIDVTGVGVNTGNTIAEDPTKTTSTSGGNYLEIYNPETGLYDVYNQDTSEVVQAGLNEQEAILAAQDLSIGEGVTLDTVADPVDPANLPAYDDEGNLLPGYELDGDGNPYFAGFGAIATNAADVNPANFPAYDDEGNLLPGYQLNEDNNPVFVGVGNNTTEGVTNSVNGITQALLNQARQQQTVRDQRQNKAQAGDWRVRLRLAPTSNYLYNDPQCGPVLWPLRNTDGVIFPYTPNIDTGYKAEYDAYNLTHSNYRGYFYKGSYVDAVNVRAMFTAQDTSEANYLLAVIHFFRSATKMFYGQDAQRGSPPPLVYLSGLGEFQFNEHPCVISQFNYTLPSDVDYIRAQTTSGNGTNLQIQRDRQTIAGNPLSYALQRLATVGLSKGALDPRAASPTLGLDNPTYVPTKMEISLTLYPMQSREQVSKQFSLKNFANGNLLKGGFW